MGVPKRVKASSSRNGKVEDLHYHILFEGLLFSAALFFGNPLIMKASDRQIPKPARSIPIIA